MLFWLVYILSEALVQDKYIKRGWNPHYLTLFFIRGVFSTIHAFSIGITCWKEYVILLLFQICSFWTIFNPLLNKLRDKDWDYQGSEKGGSGWLDDLPKQAYYILRIFTFLGMILFYIIGLKYWSF
ncbi:MAG: hypothetical protein BWY74_01254 [Firmicutes bacterium ADurb.Bin419]|nr:MAG: hypothetical protein BWY74_01254 [Firmicutes bacterium ADurb.Bin419]